MVPGDRTRENGTKMKHRRVWLNIRKHFFFNVKVAEHWHRLSTEVMVSPVLGDIHKLSDVVLGSQL